MHCLKKSNEQKMSSMMKLDVSWSLTDSTIIARFLPQKTIFTKWFKGPLSSSALITAICWLRVQSILYLFGLIRTLWFQRKPSVCKHQVYIIVSSDNIRPYNAEFIDCKSQIFYKKKVYRVTKMKSEFQGVKPDRAAEI